MFKVKVKEILIIFSVVVLALATVTLAVTEIKATGTISGLTLIPFLAGLIGFGALSMAKDFKEFKEIYEAADEE